MAANFEVLGNIQQQLIQNEIVCNDISALNKNLNNNDDFILYLNIRSIEANFPNLEVLVESLITKPFYIVCVETWTVKHSNFYILPEYKMYYNDSTVSKADGVIVYILKEIVENTEIHLYDRLKIMNTKIKMKNDIPIEISTIYRSHKLTKSEFISSLNNYLITMKNAKNHYIIGDFNIDLLTTDCYSQEFFNNFVQRGYIPCFHNVTRPATNESEKGTCIDNCFYKSDVIENTAFTLKNSITDHYTLIVKVKKNQIIKNNSLDKQVFIDYNKLKNLASSINWNDICFVRDPNYATELFLNNITYCIDNSKSKIKSKVKGRKNWITPAIIKSSKTKEKLYLEWKMNCTNLAAKDKYKQYLKIYNKIISEAKAKYDAKLIADNSNDSRKLWDIINEKVNKKNRKSSEINFIIDEHNQKITNKIDIANRMNNYFSDIGCVLSRNILKPQGTITMPPMNNNSIFLKPTDHIEIGNIIHKMKNKKGGIDNISTKVLKNISGHIAVALSHIFNLCIEFAVWPDSLKKAEIIPIYKNGSKSCESNYRPISLTSNIAKILEKIVHIRIFNFIKENRIISKWQFGFMKNIGTNDALQQITRIIYDNLDKGKPVIITFLDLAKAFDTVDHGILLKKLYCLGIRGKPLELLESYLSNRQQKVKIKDNYSEYRTIRVGVPQGTILGPLLFVLYVNDLLSRMPDETIMSYADDTAAISSANTWYEAQVKMNEMLSDIAQWLAFNKLSLNVNKTVFITFGCYSDSVPAQVDISIMGDNIKRVEQTKYLGIIFDSNLKWDKHIDYIIKKTKYLLYVFYKLSKIMSTNVLMLIYYAFFHSIIRFGNIAWGGAYNNNLQLLQTVQNKILKVINKNNPCVMNNPVNLEQLFTIESLNYHYASLRDKYLTSTSITRNKIIPLPKINKRISTKHSYNKAIKTFNLLPNDLKCLVHNKKIIKKKLLKWLKDVT